MERLQKWEEWLNPFLDYPLLRLGGATISLWTFVYFMALLVLLFFMAGKLRKWLVQRVLVRTKLDLGARQAIGSITRYLAILIGLLVALQTVGIDLTTLNVLAGAVGIGVGFGLQNIANNFISGLIILFERPIKIGDRIEVGGVDGDVIEIGARSTTVLTNDKISIIIPNSKFITDNVTNWSHTDPRVRFHIKVGVAYGSDVRRVEKLLIDVARANPNVISDPPPKVWFRSFGDSSLDFELLAWNTNLVHSKGQFISDLNFAIYETFKKHGIEIPFPQRDLHIRSGVLTTNTDLDQAEHDPRFVVQKIET
jgi:small-conductance mechanosensitive channel